MKNCLAKHTPIRDKELLSIKKNKHAGHFETGRTSVDSGRILNRSQLSTRSKNRFGDINYLKEQYASKHGPPQNNDDQEEDIKNISIYSPRGSNKINENTILWDNIEDKIKNTEDLDEDEIIELRHNLEQK